MRALHRVNPDEHIDARFFVKVEKGTSAARADIPEERALLVGQVDLRFQTGEEDIAIELRPEEIATFVPGSTHEQVDLPTKH